jgi:hypothetical protein
LAVIVLLTVEVTGYTMVDLCNLPILILIEKHTLRAPSQPLAFGLLSAPASLLCTCT